MSNSFKVIDMVTKEAMRVAHEELQFLGTIDRQYDPQFKDSGAGKKGSALRVRMPNMYTRRQASRVMDVQDQAELTQTITLATQDGVDMRFNSAELIQSVNSEGEFSNLSKNYITPAIKSLVSGIEADFLALATKATANTVGSANTAITTLVTPGAARAKLNQALAPKGDRSIQMDSVTMGGLVNGVASYFNPSGAISEQYREGLVARTAMADYYENERVWTMVNSSDVTVATEGSSALGTVQADGSYNLLNFSTTQAYTVQKVGTVFTIAGVYDVHPETKAAYASLKQFTIVTVPASATFTTISPAIFLSGPRKNVASATGATLVTTDFNTQTMVFQGDASGSYVLPLMYHREAFQFVTADLPLMDDAHKCQRITQDGLSLRLWMGSDIRNDELLVRCDILYGMAALRPEWACRMIGTKNS